jgi:hypothetical protein
MGHGKPEPCIRGKLVGHDGTTPEVVGQDTYFT